MGSKLQSKKWMALQCTIVLGVILLLLSLFQQYKTKDPILENQVKGKRQQYPYTIVTGSSANHLCSLENFLYSLDEIRSQVKVEEFPRVVVYNIGLNRTQLPVIKQLERNGLIDQVVQFDHERYPRFWDVAINAGQYGWKTGIINDARIEYGGVLIWLDAGNQVTKEFILNIHETVKSEPFHGFWSPKSDHGMGKWTHPGMFKFFGANMKEYRYKSNCNGAAIGFDTDNNTIVDTMILPWYECGLTKNCIAPPGSSRENHRQDQAALTYLAYFNGHECKIPPRDFFKLQTHRDKACKSNLAELEILGKLHHPSSLVFPKWERNDTVELYNHPEWKYEIDHVPVNIRKPSTPLLT